MAKDSLRTGFVLTMVLLVGCVRVGLAQSGPTWEVRVPPRGGPPPIEIEPPAVNFGDMKPGTKSSVVFRLTNHGEAPVELTEVRSTCWCATGNLSSDRLMPGESATLEATLDAGPDPIALDRALWVFAKGYAQPAEMRLIAEVNYGIRWHIEYLPADQTREGAVQLESVDGRAFRVISVNFGKPEFEDGFDPAKDEPRDTYVIRYTLGELGALAASEWYIVETDHPDSPVIDLPVVSEEEAPRGLRPWSAAARRVLLGQVRPGEGVERTILLRGLGEDPLNVIEEIRVEPDIAEVTPMGMAAGEEGLRVRVRITPRAGREGLIYAALVVRAKDHEESVQMMGRVVGE